MPSGWTGQGSFKSSVGKGGVREFTITAKGEQLGLGKKGTRLSYEKATKRAMQAGLKVGGGWNKYASSSKAFKDANRASEPIETVPAGEQPKPAQQPKQKGQKGQSKQGKKEVPRTGVIKNPPRPAQAQKTVKSATERLREKAKARLNKK